jgi:hypothetical protein
VGTERPASRNGLAREAYLDALPAEEQAATVRQAERIGLKTDDPDWLIAYSAQQAAVRIEAATRTLTSGTLAPEALAAIEAVVAKCAQPSEQLKEMASDLRAIRARMWSTKATSRWLMFGVFVAGLIVAFVCAVLLHFAGHRPSGQIWIAADGLARLAEVLACVITLAAGVTWWATRR